MPAKDFLSSMQKKRLQKALREGSCSHFRERVLMLLLLNDGKTYSEISDFIGCSYRTVAYWCVHGDPDKLDSLRDQREHGNFRKATEEYIQLLIEVTQKSPNNLGYQCSKWSGERLANYLAQKTGIKLSGTQVRRILKQKNIRLPRGRVSVDNRGNHSAKKLDLNFIQ
ncbi:MAG: transposase [Trichodesmium sp.]